MAALLRGNFGSLLDFAEIFTKIHAVLLKIPSKCRTVLLGKYKTKNILFVDKFSQKLLQHYWNFPQKVAFMGNFHQKMPLWKVSTKKLPSWKISTKLCLVGEFPLQQALLTNFRKLFI